MTALEQASQSVLDAARSGNLEVLAEALDARESLLLDRPTPEALAQGQQALVLLAALKQELAAEYNRMAQVRQGFAAAEHDSLIELKG